MEKSSTVLHDHEGHLETTVCLVADSAPYAEALRECFEKLKEDHRASVDISFAAGELKLVFTVESLAHYEKRKIALAIEHAKAKLAAGARSIEAAVRETVDDMRDDLDKFKETAANQILEHLDRQHTAAVGQQVEELKAKAAKDQDEQDDAELDAKVLAHLGGDQAKFDALTEPEYQAIAEELEADQAALAPATPATVSETDLEQELAKTGESTKVQ